MARRAFATLDRGERAALGDERQACKLRAIAPIHVDRTAWQHRLQTRRRRHLPWRTWHQVLPPSRRAFKEETRQVVGVRRVGGDHAFVRARHCQYRPRVAGASRRAFAEKTIAGPTLGS